MIVIDFEVKHLKQKPKKNRKNQKKKTNKIKSINKIEKKYVARLEWRSTLEDQKKYLTRISKAATLFIDLKQKVEDRERCISK